MKKNKELILYYFVVIMFLECFHKYFIYQKIFDWNLIYILILSLFFSFLFTLLSSLSNPKTNKIIIGVITFLLSFLFCGNYIYTTLFSTPFTFKLSSMASQAVSFIDILLNTLSKNVLELLILFLPFIFFCLKRRNLNFDRTFFFEKRVLIIGIFTTYLCSLLILFPFMNRSKSAFRLYFQQNDLSASVRTFGLLTAQRIDIKRAVFGFKDRLFLDDKEEIDESLLYNKLELDLEEQKINATEDELAILNYFANQNPSKKNEYTGKYKGKNLIFILAESFNQVAVDEKRTPTLYKLQNSGFRFENFYSPVFLSTTGAEFQSMTGLIPTTDTLNTWYKGDNIFPYALGNAFGSIGYTTQSYHNWSYTFYNRDKTMPTLGFPNYMACYNGIEKIMNCKADNNKTEDAEMMKKTLPIYANQEDPFVTFYITMSGHSPYAMYDDTRNREQVKNLPYSEEAKVYLAGQIDLDKAVETLIKDLEAKGLLDDTVICLVGDHYPYTMDLEEFNQMSTYKRDELFEVNHSDLYIWNNDTEVTNITKTGSIIDILPTLLNLFGIDYDSRLMVGKDLLSDSEGLAIFSDMSWISDKGRYEAKTKTFTPTGEAVSDDYITKMNNRINNSFVISKKIVETDIYRSILEGE